MRAAALVLALLALAPVAGATRHAPQLRIELVASGFRQPVDVVAAPGEPGRLYVVERAGRVRVAEGSTVAPRARSSTSATACARAGCSGSSRSPSRPATARTGGRTRCTAAPAATSTSSSCASATVARTSRGRCSGVRTPPDPYAHVGGQLAFGPGGRLNVGIGDGLDPAAAQDPASLLGKILRLDVDDPRPTPALVALGLRNPWRFSFDRQTGDLFVGDVGEVSWEEIDVIRHGTRGVVNFGWDAYEGRAPYPDARAAPPPDAVPPLVAVPPSADGLRGRHRRVRLPGSQACLRPAAATSTATRAAARSGASARTLASRSPAGSRSASGSCPRSARTRAASSISSGADPASIFRLTDTR